MIINRDIKGRTDLKDKSTVPPYNKRGRNTALERDDRKDSQVAIMADSNVLLRSSDGLFELIERNGVGINHTPWHGLKVVSNGDADRFVVEIRLNQMNARYEGAPIEHEYSGVYIAHGVSSFVETLDDTETYVQVLQSALEFSYEILEFLAGNGWMNTHATNLDDVESSEAIFGEGLRWSDLSRTDQMAVSYASDYLDQGYDLLDAVEKGCRTVSEGNAEPEYEGEDFYLEEPDFDRVYEYMKSH